MNTQLNKKMKDASVDANKLVPGSSYCTPENNECPMIEQLVTPPPHVWEKIAKALDEQDKVHAIQPINEMDGFLKADKIRKKIYFAAFAITAIGFLCFAK